MAQLVYVQHRRALKADVLLIQNIRALLAGRGEDDSALALYCGHRPAWLSKILSGERGIKLSDLDKVADFFGLAVAQLFQHGIAPLTERRRAQRRSGTDRRAGDRRTTDRQRFPDDFDPFHRRERPNHPRDDGDGGAGVN